MTRKLSRNSFAILLFAGLFVILWSAGQNASTWASPGAQGTGTTLPPPPGPYYMPMILKNYSSASGGLVVTPNGLVSDWESGRNRLFVSSRDTNSVGVFDESTFNRIATISVGSQPFGIAMSSDRVYVANYNSGTVSVINPASLVKLTDIDLNGNGCPGNPANIAVDTFSHHVFVALYGIGRVARIDPATNTMIECIHTNSGGTFGVAVHQFLGHLYVTNRDARNLQVYDVNATPSAKVGADVDVGGVPFFVQWSQVTSDVYVMVAGAPTFGTANLLQAYTASSGGVTFSRSNTIGNTEDGGTIWASGGSSALYIAATADNQVQIVDSATLAVSTNHSMTDPFAITENVALAKVYIANRSANAISTLPNNLAKPIKK